jgi:8-oxo-dGTP pyrophosphatase MutT (NUDIX family)
MYPRVQAAGILIFTRTSPKQFLLLKHRDRWDLPKGHAEPGESLMETALRETEEETGIPVEQIELDSNFRYSLEYLVSSKKYGKQTKVVTYFLGFVPDRTDPELTEHVGFEWVKWPPGKIQQQTVDPLLLAVKQYWHEALGDHRCSGQG